MTFGGEILSHTDAPPVKKTSRTLTYGPYGDISASFANYWLKFHAVNNAPFAVARSVAREIEVSHWGNIYVEERYWGVSKTLYCDPPECGARGAVGRSFEGHTFQLDTVCVFCLQMQTPAPLLLVLLC